MQVIKHEKPTTFYEQFARKGADQYPDVSHYCPGCGHGVVHNLVAEAIQDFGIQDRVILCSPVGCSVFAYYYFDVGNVQCAHGRAPAVATALRRTRSDAIIISYQGDGDLAGIGLSHIMHAANRGENITVLFINNGIYGMTGGQMAPTTPLGLRTTTTPLGRDARNDGYPLNMAELLSTLRAPVFVERVSLSNPQKVMKARRAIREAIQNQIQGKGFSFVEILSPCPVSWKMTPNEARKWMTDSFEPLFPVQNFKRITPESHLPDKPVREIPNEKVLEILGIEETAGAAAAGRSIADQHIKIAGFGGQGVISAGILLANCAVAEGFETTWLPSYGPEMRGGTANCSVTISNAAIGSPIVSYPNVLMACNLPSLDAFESQTTPGGTILVNSSLIERKVARQDVHAIYIPAAEIANQLGVRAALTIVLLAAYSALSGVITEETLRKTIPGALKQHSAVDANLKAINEGIRYIHEHYPEAVKTQAIQPIHEPA
jgi:2-oxoisovalerate ferredoxin oxidoreductase beta subunit